MKIFSVFLVISILMSSCAALKLDEEEYDTVESNTVMPSEPGKCYPKCLVQDQVKSDSIYVFEYSGQDPSKVSGVELVVLYVRS